MHINNIEKKNSLCMFSPESCRDDASLIESLKYNVHLKTN